MSRRSRRSSKTSPTVTVLVGLVLGFIVAYYTPGIGLKAKSDEVESLRLKLAEKEAEVENLTAMTAKLESELEQIQEKLQDLEERLNTTLVLLPNREYFRLVKQFIEAANNTVYVAMYVMKYDVTEKDDPVNILLDALVDAKRRGLDVRVLVDDPTKRSYADTIEFLKNHSIPVRLDRSSGITTHVKLVIIDGKYVFLGSHNWTESAL
ncbi:hypothetical protein DRO58_01400, partial [Candidatus Bathyarchaeota archaeon]